MEFLIPTVSSFLLVQIIYILVQKKHRTSIVSNVSNNKASQTSKDILHYEFNPVLDAGRG